MPISLYRIDDRLIHGQVAVGWGQPLGIGAIVLVDDEVASADWEQELYRMGTPEGIEVAFTTLAGAASVIARFAADPRRTIVLTGTAEGMRQLVSTAPPPNRAVNVGGIHHRADRVQHLRYVFLNAAETQALREIAAMGIGVTAQDVPSARPVPLEELLGSRCSG